MLGFASSFAFVAFLAQSGGGSSALTQEQRLQDLRQLIGTFQKYYALEDTKRGLGVDIRKNDAWFEKASKPDLTDGEFAELLVNWTGQLNDGHVSVTYPFNWSASLGFVVDRYDTTQSRMILRVTSINRDRLKKSQGFDFQEGWELKSINGVPVTTLMDWLAQFSQSGNRLSTERLAARQLTQRFESILPRARMSVCAGLTEDAFDSCMQTLRGAVKCDASAGIGATGCVVARVEIEDFNGKPTIYSMNWVTEGEDRTFIPATSVRETLSIGPVAELPGSRAKLVESPLKSPVALSDWPLPVDNSADPDRNFFYFTDLTDNTTGWKYGFIRIPSFSLDPAKADEQRAARVKRFGEILEGMRSYDGLILDLMGNPGGSIWFAQQILQKIGGLERGNPSFLPPLFQLRASYDWLDAVDGYLINPNLPAKAKSDYQAIRNIIANQLRTKPDELTGEVPLTLTGVKDFEKNNFNLDTELLRIPGTRNYYRMPVVVLVDEFTASAGDLFAAVVKQQQLGLVIGTRTMGAGGTVSVYRGTLATEASVTVTVSKMLDPGKNPIENVGVVPDLELPFRTEETIRIMTQLTPPNQFAEIPPFLKKVYEALRKRREDLRLPPPPKR